MNCREIEERLADYLGDELPREERARFEEHLAACASCRREAESLGGTVEALRSLPSLDPTEARHRASVLEVRRRPTLAWRILPYAACLIVGVSAGVLGSRPASPQISVPTGVTSVGPVRPPSGVAGPEGIHPTWVAAARGSQDLRNSSATPITPSFALLAEIASHGKFSGRK